MDPNAMKFLLPKARLRPESEGRGGILREPSFTIQFEGCTIRPLTKSISTKVEKIIGT